LSVIGNGNAECGLIKNTVPMLELLHNDVVLVEFEYDEFTTELLFDYLSQRVLSGFSLFILIAYHPNSLIQRLTD